MKTILFFFGFLLTAQLSFSQWVQMGSDIDGEAAEDSFGHMVSVSDYGDVVAIGTPYNDGNGSDSGHVRVYQFDGINWNQLGSDIDGEAEGDYSGISVSLSSDGNIIAIGAPHNDGDTGDFIDQRGHVRIYQFDGVNWIQLGNDIDDGAVGDASGFSVSLSDDGNRVATGAPGNSYGYVRIYEFDGVNWGQLGNDIDGEDSGDHSGRSVSLSGDGIRVAIGAPHNDSNAGNFNNNRGHVRVYQWDGINWIQLGQDIDGEADDDQSSEFYGLSLSSDGNRVAIGAWLNDGNSGDVFDQRGHVRIYEFDGVNWIQLGQDIDGEAEADYSGISVSLSNNGNIVAIGAFENDGNGPNSGHVRIYQFDGANWNQFGNDIDGETALDYFGNSVSLSSDGNSVAIGAFVNDGDNGINSGHVRVYRHLERYTPIPDPNFEQALIDQGIDDEVVLDGRVRTTHISGLTSLDVSGLDITDLTGIEDFAALQILDCSNNQLTTLDLASNTNLTHINVSGNTDLTVLHCTGTQLTGSIDLSGLPLLADLNLSDNADLVCVQVDDLAAATTPSGIYTGWTKDNTAVYSEDCHGAFYTPIPDPNFEQSLISQDIDSEGVLDGWILTSDIIELSQLNVSGANINNLSGIEAFEGLQTLNCSNNALTALDLSNNPELLSLDFSGNELTEIDLSANPNLQYLHGQDNRLLSLDLNSQFELITVDCSDNRISVIELSHAGDLETLHCQDNLINTLELPSNLISLNISYNRLENSFDFSGMSGLSIMNSFGNPVLSCIQVANAFDANLGTGIYAGWIKDVFTVYLEDCTAALYTSIPDPNFEQALISRGIDSEEILDGQVLTEDVSDIVFLIIPNEGINELTGIEAFVSLEMLICNNNDLIGHLDLSNSPNLTTLDCSNTTINSLNVNNCSNLTELYCNSTELIGSINLSSNNSLEEFDGQNNPFLDCIEVANAAEANGGSDLYVNWVKDNETAYSENCGGVMAREAGITVIKTSEDQNHEERSVFNMETIMVYPNPASDRFYVVLADDSVLERITVYDVQGEKMMETSSNSINTEHLAEGVYFVAIQILNNQRIRYKKIVISR